MHECKYSENKLNKCADSRKVWCLVKCGEWWCVLRCEKKKTLEYIYKKGRGMKEYNMREIKI